ncbi:biopolymer transporter ExbD [bacterium]|nr:biopolymer transporter ExbD [bacterium]
MTLRIKRPKKEGFSIDISALVDVLFTLLIFFSLTSSFVQESGISVDLPQASSGDAVKSEEKFTIIVDKDGGFYLDDVAYTSIDNLKEDLLKFDSGQRKRYLVVIKADLATTHGAVTQVLDLLKNLHFTNIAIATRSLK